MLIDNGENYYDPERFIYFEQDEPNEPRKNSNLLMIGLCIFIVMLIVVMHCLK